MGLRNLAFILVTSPFHLSGVYIIYENDITILYPSLTHVHVPFRLLRRPFGLIDDDEILDEEGEPKTGEQRT